jgi:hypothetical protein
MNTEKNHFLKLTKLVPMIETSFGPSELFGSRPSKESDEAWEALAGRKGNRPQQVRR